MKFKKLYGDMDWKKYGGTFISKNVGGKGEDATYYVIDVANMVENMSDKDRKKSEIGKYWVRVLSVCPNTEDEKENIRYGKKACGYVGKIRRKLAKYLRSDLGKVEMILTAGVTDNLIWQEDGNNIKSLMKTAHDLVSSPLAR